LILQAFPYFKNTAFNQQSVLRTKLKKRNILNFVNMGRIMAIDYGTKRVGIAVTDPLQIIASALDTIHSLDIYSFLTEYTNQEEVTTFVVGMPVNLQNKHTNSTSHVIGFVRKLKQNFPNIPVVEVDERFTSKIAFNAMIESGINKKKRAEKGTIDKLSATIMLQSYLEKIAL
jgi:putative holliday junction resolvase